MSNKAQVRTALMLRSPFSTGTYGSYHKLHATLYALTERIIISDLEVDLVTSPRIASRVNSALDKNLNHDFHNQQRILTNIYSPDYGWVHQSGPNRRLLVYSHRFA